MRLGRRARGGAPTGRLASSRNVFHCGRCVVIIKDCTTRQCSSIRKTVLRPQNPLRKTCDTLSPEHQLYPKRFFNRVGIKRFVMCEDLKYNGQRRRDLPDLSSGTLYIDVGDRAVCRKRHSFHHELWHMVDYHLLGNAFESHDAEWCEHQPLAPGPL
jgi:hypothetical protein